HHGGVDLEDRREHRDHRAHAIGPRADDQDRDADRQRQRGRRAPQERPPEADDAEQDPEDETAAALAQEYAGEVAQTDLADREAADDRRDRLGAGVAAGPD